MVDTCALEINKLLLLLLEYPWIFTVLRMERKMARRFAKVIQKKLWPLMKRHFFIHMI